MLLASVVETVAGVEARALLRRRRGACGPASGQHGDDVLERARRRVEVALHDAQAQFPRLFELLVRLDAFGHDGQIEGGGKTDDPLGDGPLGGPVFEALNDSRSIVSPAHTSILT